MKFIQLTGAIFLSFMLLPFCVNAQTLQSQVEKSKYYDSLRIRSANEGYLLSCGGVTYNFLEGFVFSYDYTGNPPPSHMPVRPYTKSGDVISWVWDVEQLENRNGVIYRRPPMKAEINLKTNTFYYQDGNTINERRCKYVAFSKNPNADWEDMGNGFQVHRQTGQTRVKRY